MVGIDKRTQGKIQENMDYVHVILDLLSKDVESDEAKKLYRIMQKKFKRVQKYIRIASAKIERQHRYRELERIIDKFGRQVAELEREYRETREREGRKDEPDEEEIEEDWEKVIKKAKLDTSPLEDWVEIPGQQYTDIIMSFQANFRTSLRYDADLNGVINPCIKKYTEIFDRFNSPFKAAVKYTAEFINIRTREVQNYQAGSYVTTIRYREEIEEKVTFQIFNILNNFLRNLDQKDTAWKWNKSIAIDIDVYR
jgi:hypothetical protein